MRRPRKPFVTEYKGSSRRGPKDATPKAGASRGAAKDAPSSLGWDLSGISEDSYEAALRAADALFSKGGGAGEASSAESSGHSLGAAASESGDSAGSPASASEIAAANDPGRGRILQAIDEPVADPFASLDTERVPKRRGRKPGSKNRPKGGETLKSLDLEHLGLSPGTAPDLDDAIWLDDEVDVGVEKDVAESDHPAPLAETRSLLPIIASRSRSGRFSWVRKTLKPGQRWKRRLPKVIW